MYVYKKDRAKAAALYTCGAIAIGICVALISFLVYVLHLRTEYRATCLEINDQILISPASQNFIQRGEDVFPMSDDLLEYYNMLLLRNDVIVFNRKECELTDKSIALHISDNRLTFTGLEDGSALGIRWETSDGTKTYTVRSSVISFMQMNAYLSNYIRAQNAAA